MDKAHSCRFWNADCQPVFRRLIPATLLAGSILISCPALSFAQRGTVKLNENAFAFAKELITQGRAVVDKKDSWRDHHPTAEEENEFIQVQGFAEYRKWYLGIDETHAEDTKARYKFPFGDFKNIHRCALLAVRSRALQFGYSDIENAAIQLTEIISSKKGSQSEKGLLLPSEFFRAFDLTRNTDLPCTRQRELHSAEENAPSRRWGPAWRTSGTSVFQSGIPAS